MDAVIMAGGKGTRLLPYTETIPKPLLMLGEHRIIEILLRKLQRHGVTRAVVTLGHMADQIREALGDGKRFDLEIAYFQETEPLGTCGALGQIAGMLGEHFILTNGDLLTDANLTAMIRQHSQDGADGTVGVFSLTESIPYGVLTVGEDGIVSGYQEKPSRSVEVSMGLYVLRTRALKPFFAQAPSKFDMPDLIQAMIAGGMKVSAFRGTNFWMDIGTPSVYMRAAEILAANPSLLGP
jgi:NDP-mannose synthase